VQLESYNSLHIAEIEVFGHFGLLQGVGRVSHAVAGSNVTAVVIRASNDPRDVEAAFKRAAYADALNSDILRQFETYALEYDKFGRGEVLMKDCVICKGQVKCEICSLHEEFKADIALMPRGVGGRRRRLRSISAFLSNENKLPLVEKVVPRKERPTKWDVRVQRWKKMLGFRERKRKTAASAAVGSEHVNFMKADDALEADPEALFERIEVAESVQSPNDKSKPSVDDGGDASRNLSKSMKDSLTLSTLKQSKPKLENSKTLTEGDVLETGHVVKSTIPKSMAKLIKSS